MRVLISAYACGPGDESEASAGWAFAKAAARDHDVWVFTRKRFAPGVIKELGETPELAAHLKVTFIDLPDSVVRRAKRSWDVYWYYALWQRELAKKAAALHRDVHFDVAHHVTFANDWLPCGLRRLDRRVPVVWGPVGGATQIPVIRLIRWLGARGTATEVMRAAFTWLPRRIWGDGMARRASIVVAQNRDVAERFHSARRVVVEPNPALHSLGVAEPTGDRGHRTALFVARLIGLKSPRLAVAAIAADTTNTWRLEVYGDGYERDHVVRLAKRLGVSDRVRFHGHRPRQEVLEACERADALLFPSVHDQAGWAVAEASSIGLPVICLPLGGPPVLAERNAFVAGLDGDIARNLAAELHNAAEKGGTPHNRWSVDRLPDLVEEWYSDAFAHRMR